jgi:hypothetical protein
MKFIPNHVFIITLKKYFSLSKERTKILYDRLLELNFNPQNIHFLGVNGASLVNKNLNKKYISSEFYDFSQNIGTLGASLSHGLALKLIKLKNIKEDVIILEEDAILNDNFPNILTQLPVDYDFTYLHSYWDVNFYVQNKNFDFDNVLPNGFYIDGEQATISDEVKEKFKNVLFQKIIKPPHYDAPSGIVVLAVNGKNIDKILKYIYPIKESADWHYLKQYENLNQYYVNPALEITSNPPINKSIRLALDIKFSYRYEEMKKQGYV